MSKEHTELAKKIVDQHANIIELEAFDTTSKRVKDGPDELVAKPAKVPKHSIEVAILGYPFNAYDGTADDAKKQMVKVIADDLDKGSLVLADDWAATHLG